MKPLTKIVLPRNSDRAQKVLETLDGTTDTIYLAREIGTFEVWTKTDQQPTQQKPTTRIGEYDVPGTYQMVGYNSRE
ncbi:MAG: hypothetical protein AABX24_01440 [Nanoarchaeota archaeon]